MDDECLETTLRGHTKRVFGITWSPLLPNMLLTGSDDRTARVWDVDAQDKQVTCVALLTGHSLEVRALCWHPELPNICLTGMVIPAYFG